MKTEFEIGTEVHIIEDTACDVCCIHSVGRHITAKEGVARTLRF